MKKLYFDVLIELFCREKMKISRIGKTGNKITAQHISTVSYLHVFSNSIVSDSSSKSVSFSPTQ